jgi:hypothetical protein
MSTRFWRDVWLGDSPLCFKFPRLFSISGEKDFCVGELLKEEGGRRWRDFVWRRRLFQWEEEKVITLNAPGEGFSVKSAYDSLVEIEDTNPLGDYEVEIFSKLWTSPAPSKVLVFSWQLFYDRIPTKENLTRRGVLQQPLGGDNCVWCNHNLETANHLFLHCKTAHLVWYDIFKWLGVVIIMPPNVMSLFDCFVAAAKNKKSRKGFLLIWHTVVWSLWGARNNRIFNNTAKEDKEIVEEIKVLSWEVEC